jgi:aldehyde reductase
MEKLKEEGLAKSIGVSNFNTKQIAKLLETAKVKPSMNQVESSPFLTQEKLASVCKEHGITLTAYSPFGGSPRPDKDGVVGDTKTRQSLFENETVKKLADKYGKKPSQILLKFHVQRGVVTIPKSVTKERIIENADIFDFELTEEELASLIALNKNERIVYPEVFKSCKNFPFDEE